MAKIYLNKDGVLFTRTKNHDGRFVTLHFSQDIIPFIIRNNIQLYQELPNKWKENSSTLDYIFTLNNGEDKKTACIFTTKCPICSNTVYYYENELGSKVFFDTLGPEWKKHPCIEYSDKQKNWYKYTHNDAVIIHTNSLRQIRKQEQKDKQLVHKTVYTKCPKCGKECFYNHYKKIKNKAILLEKCENGIKIHQCKDETISQKIMKSSRLVHELRGKNKDETRSQKRFGSDK